MENVNINITNDSIDELQIAEEEQKQRQEQEQKDFDLARQLQDNYNSHENVNININNDSSDEFQSDLKEREEQERELQKLENQKHDSELAKHLQDEGRNSEIDRLLSRIGQKKECALALLLAEEGDLTIPDGYVIVLPGTGKISQFCHAGRLVFFLLQQSQAAHNPFNKQPIDVTIIDQLAGIMGISLENLYNLIDDFRFQSSYERLRKLNVLLQAKQGKPEELQKRQAMLSFLNTQEAWRLALTHQLE